MIPYARQSITDADIAAVAEALREPFLTQGPAIARFEAALASAVGARYAVALNSGTAALHAAYFAAGIGPDHGIVTSPITFVATANAALYLAAPVHFADVDDTVMLDPRVVHAADDIRVIVPVHFGGQVADLSGISTLAREHGWAVIEDAAHALGATYTTGDGRDYRVGGCAHSAMCCFSFHAVKHITTGEGGAVTTNDEALHRRLVRFRSHGITRDRAQCQRFDGPWYYEQHDLGFNYRITDFQATLGTKQLARLPRFVARRREIAAQYDEAFAGVEGVKPVAKPPCSSGSYHLYIIRVPAEVRLPVFEGLIEAGIGVNVHYIPVHHQPMHRSAARASLPKAERYYSEAITLPMFPDLTDENVRTVVAKVDEVVSRALARTGAATAGA